MGWNVAPGTRVISLFLKVPETDRDMLIAQLMELGLLGAVEEPGGLRVFFDDPSAFDASYALVAQYHPEPRTEDPVDWARETRDAWPPMVVGERFWLAPYWVEDAAPQGRLRLTVYPGMACGTGAAPATQLALQMMERWVPPNGSVLDVGTGTGILADAALLLGASPVFACDIDGFATGIAKANVGERVPLFTGSVRSVRAGTIDVVVANLNPATLEAIGRDMRNVLKPGGTLILSGFREYEAAGLAARFAGPVRDRADDSGWSSLVL